MLAARGSAKCCSRGARAGMARLPARGRRSSPSPACRRSSRAAAARARPRVRRRDLRARPSPSRWGGTSATDVPGGGPAPPPCSCPPIDPWKRRSRSPRGSGAHLCGVGVRTHLRSRRPAAASRKRPGRAPPRRGGTARPRCAASSSSAARSRQHRWVRVQPALEPADAASRRGGYGAARTRAAGSCPRSSRPRALSASAARGVQRRRPSRRARTRRRPSSARTRPAAAASGRTAYSERPRSVAAPPPPARGKSTASSRAGSRSRSLRARARALTRHENGFARRRSAAATRLRGRDARGVDWRRREAALRLAAGARPRRTRPRAAT